MKTTTTSKIAIIGARGIGNYGGFESVVSELGPSLVKRGYIVYCSCEKSGTENENKEYLGVRKIFFPIKPPANYTIRKVFEILYDMYFTIKCSFSCDIIYALGLGANFSLLIPRLFGKVSIVNVDGLEWRRSKFNLIEKILLKIMFLMCCISSSLIIVDNKELIGYISQRFHKKTVFIPYGVNPVNYVSWDSKRLDNLKTLQEKSAIIQNEYWLVVSRLEPENNIHTIVEGFIKSETPMPLVIIGDFTSEIYKKRVSSLISNSKRQVLFLGSIYDPYTLNMFRQNCFGYFHGHSVGGTNPSLLEAMVMENIIIAHDNEFNREVGGNAVLYFTTIEDLKNRIELIEKNPWQYSEFRKSTLSRVELNYSWENIIDEYDSRFSNLH